MEMLAFALFSLAILWTISLVTLIIGPSILSRHRIPFLADQKAEDKKRKSILFVTAHPDDESMFFVPTIRYLVSECGYNIYILCISTGNAEGKGSIRAKEMLHACSVLNIPTSNVTILDHKDLQDGFDKLWSHNLLAEIIKRTVDTHDIDEIITFDNYGISGHPQHRAVHYGVCKFLVEREKLSERHQNECINAWELVSINFVSKYSGPMQIWHSIVYSLWIENTESYCILNNCPPLCFQAMAKHYSQWIWFRKLFVLFSSYGYVNILRKFKF